MNTNIIKDLIPSYIDGLTSPESNQLIEQALAGDPTLRAYYEEMKANMAAETKVGTKEIDPLKKVRKINRLKIILGVISSAVLVCALVIGYFFYFNKSWAANSQNVTQKISSVGGVVELMYSDKDKKLETLALQDPDYLTKDGYQPSVRIKQKRISPIDPPLQKNGYVGFTFKDAKTIYLSNGMEHQLSDWDVLTVKYEDKTEKIKIQDLYQK